MTLATAVPDIHPIVPATARGAATRRRLLQAAEIEFGERGFHAASVSSVTSRAGVGQGTFYLYFHSKEEIFITLVRDIGRTLRKEMSQARASELDALDGERAALIAFFAYTKRHPGLYRIVQECQFVDEEEFRRYYLALARDYQLGIEAGSARGTLSPGNASVRAWMMIGIGHFVGLKHCLWDGALPSEDTLDCVMEFIERGLRAETPYPY